jgi:E3 ubiquitin-protein ligase MARCH6
MPDRLPLHLVIRRFAQQSFFACLFIIRAALVTSVWLGVLPWIVLCTWRAYFTMGEST